MTPTLPTFVTYALGAVGAYRYPILFLGTAIEGPILMIACGFLLHYNVVEIVPLFIALVLGDLVADIAWYYIGKSYADPFISKYGDLFHISPELFQKGKDLFAQYHTKILLISKVTIGFGMSIATLMAAGATKTPLRKFLIINGIGEVILVAIMLSIGFFFGAVFEQIASGFRVAFLAGLTIVVITGVYGFARLMKQRIAHL